MNRLDFGEVLLMIIFTTASTIGLLSIMLLLVMLFNLIKG